MTKMDFNCFVGGWPFHRVRCNSLDKLMALHRDNGIDGAFVSSTDAIFYNDPYEADELLAQQVQGTNYRHVMTVNPMLPGCLDDIRRGVEKLHIAGVRILPGFHDYTLDSPEVAELCELLRTYHLPLFLTLRMEDDRVAYLFYPKTIPIWDIGQFLGTQMGFPILLCNVRISEIRWLKQLILSRSDVYVDTSGLKDGLFSMEALSEEQLTQRLIYGSLAPIFCLKSTLLLIERAEIPALEKEKMLSGEGFLKVLEHPTTVVGKPEID